MYSRSTHSNFSTSVLAAVFFLGSTGSVAFEPEHSTIVYGADKEFETGISDVQLIGQLSVPGKEPYLVFTGRDADKNYCFGICDPETNVYFQSPSDIPPSPEWVSGAYPGDYYVIETGARVRQVRMFIGRCIDSREEVVWFTHQTLPHTFPDDVSLQFVDGGGIQTQSFTSQRPGIDVALAAVTKGTCREIASRQFHKAAAYYAAEIPAFTADGRCIVSPLGPGRPGIPLAYLDKRENILLYVESDGRHVAAIDSHGDLLWVRDPFTDSKLCPYRSERPIVVRIGPIPGEAELAERLKTKGPLLLITFDSSQFGAVDLANGNFFDLGQN